MSFSADALALVVTDIADIGPGVRSYRLEHPDRRPLPAFGAGAHIVVTLDAGPKIHRNAYTLTGSPDDRTAYTIAVLHQTSGRGGSDHLHRRVAIGDRVAVRPPTNYFAVARNAKRHLLVAGGIGVTPFLGMARELSHDGAEFELHFAVRSREQVGLVQSLVTEHAERVRTYVGETGQRLSVRDLLASQRLGTHVYVCGPARLVETVVGAARDLNWPATSVHVERFQYDVGGEPFTVELLSSNAAIHVAADQSLLEALEAAGHATQSQCRMGACGKCRVAVHRCEGRLIHNDHALDPEERADGTAMIPCVSRFEGRRLVLDL